MDISGNSAIASLDFSEHMALAKFRCVNNAALTSVNLKDCTDLTDLHCEDDVLLSTISLGNCTVLESLVAANCALASIDVTNYPSLVLLNVRDNSLQKIDVRNNPALEALNASGLSISELDLTRITQLKTLDVANNASLTKVICPSQDWINSLIEATNDTFLAYMDSDENIIYGGTTEIDGLTWANMNVGWTFANKYGNAYNFDDAQKACPEGWRIPTKEELESLSRNYSSWVTENRIEGRWFSGSKAYAESVPAIFPPHEYDYNNHNYYYWSSTLDNSNNNIVYILQNEFVRMGTQNRYAYSQYARCVK